ncbi:putative bifunctional dihydroflavonol 4-reductase/flavanone 4-reductase-like [Apostichopus japonicus]|uniref:Putative bifunctional dihydroflavonol 4-reductase/flavanone 4-reductase-like n=1 Tax=Stichopus japonicus TaxID=307972 RepID=A0A2G8KM01_STIJA|nr:putative bifunctional dihydroflavonol 4-reductase/flavanone 4-reductase-like [Apostichopus japonicus]
MLYSDAGTRYLELKRQYSLLKLYGVLVTGASGYVATGIVNDLLNKGYLVRGTVRSLKNPGKVKPLKSMAEGKPGKLELVEADLLKPETWKSAVSGCSHVLHTASPFPFAQPKNAEEVIRPAVDGTISVLEACKQDGNIKRVVVTSSIAAVEVRIMYRPEDRGREGGRAGAGQGRGRVTDNLTHFSCNMRREIIKFGKVCRLQYYGFALSSLYEQHHQHGTCNIIISKIYP